MLDQTAFFSLSYGLYVIASKDGERRVGCIANTFQQVTASPLQASVALHKENTTTDAVRASKRFTATCLSQEATMDLIGTFGFHSSKDRDKFATCTAGSDGAGLPFIAEQACARFSVRVLQEIDLGSHILFVGEVEEAEKLEVAEPMTYAHYHLVKGGKTPPKASSYLSDVADATPAAGSALKPAFAWRCQVCGHLEYVDELPDDYVCPVCGVGKEMFERVEVE